MPTSQTIVESLRKGSGANLSTQVAGSQNPDLDGDDGRMTAEDVLKILARAKKRQPEGLPESAE
jgi:hypothetical protein